jgi:hypothetical protein
MVVTNEVSAENLVITTQNVSRVEPVSVPPVSSEELWNQIDQARASEELNRAIARARSVN